MTQSIDEFDIAAVPMNRSGFQRFFDTLAAIGTAWIFALMLLIVADVLGRNFFNQPITGVAEFAGRSVVGIVFLQLASAIGVGSMTRSDFMLRLIGDRAPRLVGGLDIVYSICGAALFAFLAWISIPELRSAWNGNEYFGVQGIYMIPLWPFRALIAVGSILAAVAYALWVPRLFEQYFKNP